MQSQTISTGAAMVIVKGRENCSLSSIFDLGSETVSVDCCLLSAVHDWSSNSAGPFDSVSQLAT